MLRSMCGPNGVMSKLARLVASKESVRSQFNVSTVSPSSVSFVLGSLSPFSDPDVVKDLHKTLRNNSITLILSICTILYKLVNIFIRNFFSF